MENNFQITWVNHASFIIQTDEIKLISDPWIEGRVFNGSWDLLLETKFQYEDFKDITHIWFSHEHPDHFFPPNLKKIPEDIRAKITVLFQWTEDKKVVRFCENLGFKEVMELSPGEWLTLGANFKIVNESVSNDTDSWLFMDIHGKKLLNLNDCVFHKSSALENIKQRFGKVDILFTQFSYASWVGNPDDPASKKHAADEKLETIKEQIKIFEPEWVVPFASFVWFCAKENFHMNEQANKVDGVIDVIKSSGAHPVLLTPNDSWNGDTGSLPDQTKNRDTYLDGIDDLVNRKLTKYEEVSFDELSKTAKEKCKKDLAFNNKAKLKGYAPMNVFLTDLKFAVSFDYRNGLQKSELEMKDCDVAMPSQNLNYILTTPWGFDTIRIAGTFIKPNNGDFKKIEEYQWIATLNNQGKRMNGLLRRAIDRIVRLK